MSRHLGRLKRRAGTDVPILLNAINSAPPAKRRPIFATVARPVGRATRRDASRNALSLDEISPSAACTGFRELEEEVFADLEESEA